MPDGASSSATIACQNLQFGCIGRGICQCLACCPEDWSLTALYVFWDLVGIWCVRAQHLLILRDTNTLALDHLDIVQTREDLVLNLEFRGHSELGTFLDL